MAELLSVAKCLNDLHTEKHGFSMDEMKMHKMMYFSQRESLMIYGTPLFDGDFEAWKYGPVLLDVRYQYFNRFPFSSIVGNVSSGTKKLLSIVLERYGSISSWTLSSISHNEISWKLSRKGLDSSDNGNNIMLKEAIRLDAERESIARQIGTALV